MTANKFNAYFTETIEPLVNEANYIKQKYHSRFWGYFWTVFFIMTANLLWALFNNLMYDKPLNYEQLILVNLIAVTIIFLPIYFYKRIPKNDIFDTFIQFYGHWEHLKDSEVALVHSPIIPAHDTVRAEHNVRGEYNGVQMEMRDTFYGRGNAKKQKIISGGVILFLRFKQPFEGRILMFDKSGFYRKNKFASMEYYNDKLNIPAANYFNIFTDNIKFAHNFLLSLFFEQILDMKDTFAAKHMYVEITDNIVRIYFEGSRMYLDNYKFWSKPVDKKKFAQLNDTFEKSLALVDLINVLAEPQNQYAR